MGKDSGEIWELHDSVGRIADGGNGVGDWSPRIVLCGIDSVIGM